METESGMWHSFVMFIVLFVYAYDGPGGRPVTGGCAFQNVLAQCMNWKALLLLSSAE